MAVAVAVGVVVGVAVAVVVAMNLDQYLQVWNNSDELLDDPSFDSKSFMQAFRGKVDRVKFKRDELINEAAYHLEMSKLHAKRARTRKNSKIRFDKYIRMSMESAHTERLFGDEFFARLQNSAAQVDCIREPTPKDFIDFNEFVRIKRSYEWDKDAIKKALKAGIELPFASLKKTKRVVFDLNSKTLDDKKSRKLPKGTINVTATESAAGAGRSVDPESEQRADSAGSAEKPLD